MLRKPCELFECHLAPIVCGVVIGHDSLTLIPASFEKHVSLIIPGIRRKKSVPLRVVLELVLVFVLVLALALALAFVLVLV